MQNLREKEREVAALRELLARTRTMSDPETRLAGLIDVVESLVGQLGRQPASSRNCAAT